MKRTYYNYLTELLTKKLMYTNRPNSIEKVKAEMKFLEVADSQLKRQLKITKLSNSIDIIDNMFEEYKAFSAFGKWLIE
ncbi:MAG: hypothetical protein IKU54_04940 [Oscillospiraceae bacterium]|nr:hypothetical protein [Oscillospiraceae bacterium]